MTGKTFNLRVQQEQLIRWRAKATAAGRSLAGWIKGLCDAEAGTPRSAGTVIGDALPYIRGPKELSKTAATGSARSGKPVKRKLEKKNKSSDLKCIHGTKKGWRCWQCRGLAIVRRESKEFSEE